jgi:hypothetical protein
MSILTESAVLTSLLNSAVIEYENQTGIKLADHPLTRKFEGCDSAESVTALLQDQVRAFREFRGSDSKMMNFLKRAVYVLQMLSTSALLGEGIGLVRLKPPRVPPCP